MTFAVLGPILAEYLDLYPEVRIDLVCSDRRVDLIEERFDLALQAGPSPGLQPGGSQGRDDSPLPCSPPPWPCSSASVVRSSRRTSPTSPASSSRPRATPGRCPLEASSSRSRCSHASVNDYDLLRAVARSGFGIASCPSTSAR